MAIYTVPDLITAYRDARRACTTAYFTYRVARGAAFLPALDAWLDAEREARRLEVLFIDSLRMAA